MNKVDFIFQDELTHEELINQLSKDSYQECLISVAFATRSGFLKVQKGLEAKNVNVKMFIGIDNGITTYQALLEILKSGIKLFVVDIGDYSRLFHQKIYLFKNSYNARLIIGSANLTLGGLISNNESSILLNLDLTNEKELETYTKIEEEYRNLELNYPKNIFEIKTIEQIDELFLSRKLKDENKIKDYKPINPISPDDFGSCITYNIDRQFIFQYRKHITNIVRELNNENIELLIFEYEKFMSNFDINYRKIYGRRYHYLILEKKNKKTKRISLNVKLEEWKSAQVSDKFCERLFFILPNILSIDFMTDYFKFLYDKEKHEYFEKVIYINKKVRNEQIYKFMIDKSINSIEKNIIKSLFLKWIKIINQPNSELLYHSFLESEIKLLKLSGFKKEVEELCDQDGYFNLKIEKEIVVAGNTFIIKPSLFSKGIEESNPIERLILKLLLVISIILVFFILFK